MLTNATAAVVSIVRDNTIVVFRWNGNVFCWLGLAFGLAFRASVERCYIVLLYLNEFVDETVVLLIEHGGGSDVRCWGNTGVVPFFQSSLSVAVHVHGSRLEVAEPVPENPWNG